MTIVENAEIAVSAITPYLTRVEAQGALPDVAEMVEIAVAAGFGGSRSALLHQCALVIQDRTQARPVKLGNEN